MASGPQLHIKPLKKFISLRCQPGTKEAEVAHVAHKGFGEVEGPQKGEGEKYLLLQILPNKPFECT